MEDARSGKLDKHFKSQEIPENDVENYVKVVVGKTYD